MSSNPPSGDETTISATGEHPFLVARAGPHAAALDTRADPEAVALVEPLDTRDRTGQDLAGHGRWVPASDLAEGDAVRTMSPQGVAGTATVTKIRGRHAVVPVYNLTVEGTSRYLVGACGVVVHNCDAVREAVRRADASVAPGRGPTHGTRVHAALEAEIKALNRPDLLAKISFKDGVVVPRGTPGSIRLDVVEVSSSGKVITVWDLKTGGAKLSIKRIGEIQQHLPNQAPVHEIRP